jgi:hypothetical protein
LHPGLRRGELSPLRPAAPQFQKAIMSGYRKKLDELKSMLVKAEDFSTVQSFFFDHVTCHRSFVQASEPAKNDKLEAILKLTGGQILGKECSLSGLMMLEVKEHSLFHGGVFMNGCIATIIYFSDIDIGMIAVDRAPGTGLMSFARIACLPNNGNVTAASLASGSGTLQ